MIPSVQGSIIKTIKSNLQTFKMKDKEDVQNKS